MEMYLLGQTDYTTGLTIATPGAHQTVSGGNYDAFLVKFNSSGVRQWGTFYGGLNDERPRKCISDASGNIYIAGYTESSTGTLVATPGSHQSNYGGGVEDGFLVKFNSSGIRQWGTYYGGANSDVITAMCVDLNNNIFIGGSTSSTAGTLIATPGSHQSTFGGGVQDGFFVKFNSSGIRQWGTYYGGTGTERLESCNVDLLGNVFISGETESST